MANAVEDSQPPKKRGRPRKSAVETDSPKPIVPQSTALPAKRGRPSNAAKVKSPQAVHNANTASRGRGRPKKHETQSSPREQLKKPENAADSVPGEAESRKRGRPKKSAADVNGSTVGVGGTPLKRGRPKKAENNVDHLPKEEIPRKRGRPKKDQTEEGNIAGEEGELEQSGKLKKAKVSTSDSAGFKTEPKPRGRPRKAEALENPDAGISELESKGGPAQDKVDRENGSFPQNPTPEATESTRSTLLKNMVGTYDIECDEVKDIDPEMAKEMKMTITKTKDSSLGLIAGFHLGVINGTMLLATDENSLDMFEAQMSNNGQGHDTGYKAFQEPGLGDGGEGLPKEGARTPENPSRRIFFKWRGKDTSTGTIYPGTTSEQRGYIDFDDDEATGFIGVSDFPILGMDCNFAGSMISAEDGDDPEPWCNFSEDALQKATISKSGQLE